MTSLEVIFTICRRTTASPYHIGFKSLFPPLRRVNCKQDNSSVYIYANLNLNDIQANLSDIQAKLSEWYSG